MEPTNKELLDQNWYANVEWDASRQTYHWVLTNREHPTLTESGYASEFKCALSNTSLSKYMVSNPAQYLKDNLTKELEKHGYNLRVHAHVGVSYLFVQKDIGKDYVEQPYKDEVQGASSLDRLLTLMFNLSYSMQLGRWFNA